MFIPNPDNLARLFISEETSDSYQGRYLLFDWLFDAQQIDVNTTKGVAALCELMSQEARVTDRHAGNRFTIRALKKLIGEDKFVGYKNYSKILKNFVSGSVYYSPIMHGIELLEYMFTNYLDVEAFCLMWESGWKLSEVEQLVQKRDVLMADLPANTQEQLLEQLYGVPTLKKTD